MNFTTLPPEVISGRMHAGPGPGPMDEAATAWARLATRLHTAVADYRAVTAKLTPTWEGPPAAHAGAAPYIDWLSATAIRAEQAATQAAAAARAQETALAATVPPAVIGANRTLRRSLVLADPLGLTGPAIADTEADYERMWARDAAAMYAYAEASADAAVITPFTSPPGPGAVTGPPAQRWALKSAPDVVSAGRQLISAAPAALRALSRSPLAAFDVSLASSTCPLSQLASLTAPAGVAIAHLNSLNKAAALRCLLPNRGGVRGAPITARAGHATPVGALSVPPSWAAAATPMDVCRGTVA
ncbi:PPE family protein [Mycobacterium seoulense]|uniref:Putative PPE family protein PPE32 n=1 Tax=Mycobacterium seoulense TaxID=386911 RepID=A0A7I7NTK6_9MYCO|nr:PPE family protein [Mycobacterium seoulense]MCV7440061.1 PPE family protein [Mycobacterium seoulense]BBX99996.1 putative PPE family protein PPE32 [Mycobacterium seoulense]